MLLIGMLPLLVLAVITYIAGHKIERNTTASYHTVATHLSDLVERNLFERYGDVQAFGLNEAVQDRTAWYQVGSEQNKIAAAANHYASLYGIYQVCLIVDTEGKVIAVGSGRVLDDGKRVPLEVKVGDRVLLGKYVGTEVKIDDKENVIVREDEVLGIIQ